MVFVVVDLFRCYNIPEQTQNPPKNTQKSDNSASSSFPLYYLPATVLHPSFLSPIIFYYQLIISLKKKQQIK